MMMTRTPPRRGGNDDEHGGQPLGNPFRRRHEADDPLGATNETPVDLAAVQGDDALLDMLGGAEVARGDADAELARVLVRWRREVDAEPSGGPDTDLALAAIRAGRPPRRREPGCLSALLTVVAVLVITFSGLGLVAKSAEPGEALWSVTEVLYADYVASVEAAATVEAELWEAQTALGAGDTTAARRALERAREQLPLVAASEGRAVLDARCDELTALLGGGR